MIDKDEYPQTAEIESRCVNMLADLWNAPDAHHGVGVSTTGSSEACHARRDGAAAQVARASPDRGHADRPPQHRDGRQRPGLLAQVRPLLGRRAAAGPDGGRSLRADAGGGGHAVRREHDRRGPASSARPSPASTSRSPRSATRSTSSRSGRASTSRSTSTPRAAASSRRSSSPISLWDFRLPRVKSINASGHKFGLAPLGVGWVIWRDAGGSARGADLPGQLPRRRHAHLRAQLLAARRPDRRPVLQLPPPRPGGLPEDPAGRAGRRPAISPTGSRTLGPFGIITRGTDLRRCRGRSRTAPTSPCSSSRTRSGSTAGRCPPTRCPRTARTSRSAASSSATASARDLARPPPDDLGTVLDRFAAEPDRSPSAVGPPGFSHT